MRATLKVVLLVGAVLAATLTAPKAVAATSAVLDNGTVSIGVQSLANLGADGVGLRYNATGDAIMPGCVCEGWGAGDASSATSGYASANFGSSNIDLEAFDTDGAAATSITQVAGRLRVTHEFAPSVDPRLFEVTVTIQNVSASAVDLRYRRVMDWDVPPTEFSEFVTIGGAAPEVVFTSDDGFASPDPLAGPSSINFTGNATDNGPADHGALFDFDFGPLGSGQSRGFVLYYGAAGTEADADAALAAVGAEAFSYGQPSTPSGPTLGTPNTFIFAFRDLPSAPGNADLSATNTVDKTVVEAGSSVVYTTGIANAGPDAAARPRLFHRLPSRVGVTSVSAPTGWTCQTFAGSVSSLLCSSASLAPGASAGFTFSAKVDPALPKDATMVSTAVASSDTADPDSSNNAAEASFEAEAVLANVAVEVSGAPDPVVAGDEVTWTITLTRTGRDDAKSPRLDFYWPWQVERGPFTAPAGWTCTSPAFSSATTCSRSAMRTDEAVFTAKGTVRPDSVNGDILYAYAEVRTSPPDAEPSDNTFLDETQIIQRYPSDDCADGDAVFDGYLGELYARIRTTTVDEDTAAVCVRIDPQSVTSSGLARGGKFMITAPPGEVAPPTVDEDTAACAKAPADLSPTGSLEADVGDPSDPATYGSLAAHPFVRNGQAWLCVELTQGTETISQRIVFDTNGLVTVVFAPDPPFPFAVAPAPADPALPSSSCQKAAGVRIVDAEIGDGHLRLYAAQAGAKRTLCARVEGSDGGGGGGSLVVDTTGFPGVAPTGTGGVGGNPACTLNVFTSQNPPLTVRRSAEGTPTLCVSSAFGAAFWARAGVTGTPTAPNVSFTPDP